MLTRLLTLFGSRGTPGKVGKLAKLTAEQAARQAEIRRLQDAGASRSQARRATAAMIRR